MFARTLSEWLSPAARSGRPRNRLALEALEDRTLPAINFTALANGLDGRLASIDAAMNAIGRSYFTSVLRRTAAPTDAEVEALVNSGKDLARFGSK